MRGFPPRGSRKYPGRFPQPLSDLQDLCKGVALPYRQGGCGGERAFWRFSERPTPIYVYACTRRTHDFSHAKQWHRRKLTGHVHTGRLPGGSPHLSSPQANFGSTKVASRHGVIGGYTRASRCDQMSIHGWWWGATGGRQSGSCGTKGCPTLTRRHKEVLLLEEIPHLAESICLVVVCNGAPNHDAITITPATTSAA